MEFEGVQSPNVYCIVWRFNNITDCLAYMTTLYCEQFSRDSVNSFQMTQ